MSSGRCDQCRCLCLWGLTEVQLAGHVDDQGEIRGKLCGDCLPEGLAVGLTEVVDE